MSKYAKFKTSNLILVGATLIFVVSPYWPDAINFITLIAGGSEMAVPMYLFIATVFIAPLHITWMMFWSDVITDKRKALTLIFTIEAVIYEIVLISVFFMDFNLIGTKLDTFVVQFGDIFLYYLIISIAMFLLTGFVLVRDLMKSKDSETKLKGKVLLIAFITFAIGTLIDVLFADAPSEVTIVLARVFVIFGLFSFYVGFTMPNFVKKRFIK